MSATQHISNNLATEHIKAEARVRGDLDDVTVKALADALSAGGESWGTYTKWAERILILREQHRELDDRTCNALAVYLIRRGNGYTHDAVDIVNRFVSQS